MMNRDRNQDEKNGTSRRKEKVILFFMTWKPRLTPD